MGFAEKDRAASGTLRKRRGRSVTDLRTDSMISTTQQFARLYSRRIAALASSHRSSRRTPNGDTEPPAPVGTLCREISAALRHERIAHEL